MMKQEIKQSVGLFFRLYYFSSHASYFIHAISHMVLFVTWFAWTGA